MKNVPAVLLAILLVAGISAAQTPSSKYLATTDIVSRLVENNHKRAEALQAYTGQREYHLLYTGVGGRHEANMLVQVNYHAPSQKEFTVESQSGSGIIINKVFKRLLESEKDATDATNQARTALTEDNYSFELAGRESVDQRDCYILKVTPHTSNKYLYRGRVWVDAADFAVVKIESEPAKQPSFWISKTAIHHQYEKIGEFWLPAENVSTSDLRIGGHATLSIHYREYVTDPPAASAASVADSSPVRAAKAAGAGH